MHMAFSSLSGTLSPSPASVLDSVDVPRECLSLFLARRAMSVTTAKLPPRPAIYDLEERGLFIPSQNETEILTCPWGHKYDGPLPWVYDKQLFAYNEGFEHEMPNCGAWVTFSLLSLYRRRHLPAKRPGSPAEKDGRSSTNTRRLVLTARVHSIS